MSAAAMNPALIPALTIPRALFAAGAIAALPAELAALGVRRPLLVTDKGLVAAGVAAIAIAAYGNDAALVVFDNVTENPIFSDVDNAAALYQREGCDGVVALGGGSVIDVAKVVALLGKNPGSVRDYMGKPGASPVAGVPLIVIPTTAGTGSEASPSAGIHPDPVTPSIGTGSRYLVPTVAILDPNLTRSLPQRLIAATGIDALSHCIEGYLSKKSVPLGESIALDGIARVARNLRRAVNDRDDGEARGEMMLAAFAGGISIGMGLGPAHAVALACSDQGFHHGVLSGIGLVATLDATAERFPEKAAAIARAFGLDPSASLARSIASLMRELGLPATLAELKYSAGDVKALGTWATKSHFNLSAPFHPSADEYEAMFAASLKGEKGD